MGVELPLGAVNGKDRTSDIRIDVRRSGREKVRTRTLCKDAKSAAPADALRITMLVGWKRGSSLADALRTTILAG